MERFKKFKLEYKKDFIIPSLSTTKEKDIFTHIFQLQREKIIEEYIQKFIIMKSYTQNQI